MTTKHKLLLIASLLSLSPGLLSGQRMADSLWAVFNLARTDTAKVNTLLQLGMHYSAAAPDSAFLLFDRGLSLAEQVAYPEGIGQAHLQTGILLLKRSDYAASIEHLRQASSLFQQLGDDPNLALAYNRAGLAYYRVADYTNALDQYEKSLEIENRLTNPIQLAGLLQNMALVYERLGDYTKALDLLERSLEEKKKAGDEKQLISTYSAFGTVYQKLKQFEEAKKNYLAALNLAEKANDTRGVILTKYNIGTVLEKQDNTDEALKLYLECLKLSKELDFKPYTPAILEAIGNISMRKGNYELAESQFKEALEMKEAIGDQHGAGYTYLNLADLFLRTKRPGQAAAFTGEAMKMGQAREILDLQKEGYFMLMKIDSVQGNFGSALANFRKGHELADSMVNLDVKKRLADLAAQNELQTATLQLKESERNLVILKSRAQRNWFLAVCATLFLISTLLLALWLNYLQKQKINQQLALKNTELLESNGRLQHSNQQLGLANNKLQQFTFAASHDLRESSRAVTSFAQLLRRNSVLEGDHNGYLDYILQGSRRMNKTLDDLLSYTDLTLREELREPTDLGDLIRQSMTLLPEDTRQLAYNLNIGELPEVSANPALLKKLFINLIDNGIRFGQAGVQPEITVSASQNDEETVFCVQDNGIGMEEQYLEQIFEPFFRLHPRGVSGSGLGLAVCERIVRLYGGRIWAVPGRSGGLGIHFTLPGAF